ncbi:uncharacterized protein LOC100829911 [Brachypodium distachyon]|uniref:Uncharacterized protein n=1 Tax=Brachypodium distachyon TaxID=15368 RepID=A0A0Q3J733_BRADI|nr:uncharacterized protein LOC100829911 [Brachypodium distachyon]KQJ93912.1 hypothetical protein BRADI_3g07440v3 [Brachypodium distachyon]|eukprot:XP_014755849.1 uncharacterized protein LOC100829911 [Brachypodium distachyon]
MSSSSSSSSIGASLALAAATAMALSGSLVLFSLRRFAKPAEHDDDVPASPASLRPCLSSSSSNSERRPRRKGEKKRVRFAAGVVDNEGAAPPVARSSSSARPSPSEPTCRGSAGGDHHRMPANREALYRGMLRDRSVHRTAYSY